MRSTGIEVWLVALLHPILLVDFNGTVIDHVLYLLPMVIIILYLHKDQVSIISIIVVLVHIWALIEMIHVVFDQIFVRCEIRFETVIRFGVNNHMVSMPSCSLM